MGNDVDRLPLVRGDQVLHLFLRPFFQFVVKILVFSEGGVRDDLDHVEQMDGAFVFCRDICGDFKRTGVFLGKIRRDENLAEHEINLLVKTESRENPPFDSVSIIPGNDPQRHDRTSSVFHCMPKGHHVDIRTSNDKKTPV
jgi:hypothetical protein